MGFVQGLEAVGQAIANPLPVAIRDAGHAINAGQNLIDYGQLHAPAGSAPGAGTGLVNYADAQPNAPGTIINTAGVGSAPTSSQPQPNRVPVQAPGQAPYTPGGSTSGGGGGISGVGGTSLNAPLYVQGIQQQYGAVLNNAPTAQDILSKQEGGQEQQFNDQAGSAIANAQQQYQGNHAVIQGQIGTTQQGQQLSLQELANQIRAMHQGLGAQLGSSGAGSSSAAEMGNRGIAEEQNTQRANIQQQAGSNITNLQNQDQAQQADTQTLVEGYKKTATDQVATVRNNYAQLMNQLQVSLGQAQGEEKARLAEFGQNLTDAAKQSLQVIEDNLTKNTSSLLTQGTSSLQQGTLPQVQQVNPITMSPVNPNSPVSPTGGNATSAGAPNPYLALLQQEKNQPISGQ